MLAIFDDVAACEGVRELFIDIAVSLFRQWVLRPDFRCAAPGEPVAFASGDVPVLASLASYTPRPAAMLIGCLLSIALLVFIVTASIRPGPLPSWLIGVHSAKGSLVPASRSSLAEAEPNTLVKLGTEPENPWPAVASRYFELIPVLKVLDTDGDFVISPSEIIAAPSTIRRLDLNHDGKLSPEECGFWLGPRPQDTPDPEFVRAAKTTFMRAHPVLATLDADRDSEISTDEINGSSRLLRILDSNHDGFLTPDEVVPELWRARLPAYSRAPQ